MEKHTLSKPVTETLGSISSFSGIIYIIFLTLSICYNIGYLKQINPQIIDLISLDDYINDTLHNIWFFLLGALLFVINSLIKRRETYNKTIIFSIFAFCISAYYLLKGAHNSKFWPFIKEMFTSNIESLIIYAGTIIFSLVILEAIYQRYKKFYVIPQPSDSFLKIVSPVIIFLTIVIMPYIGGITEGYIENKYLTKDDYNVVHSVDIKVHYDNDEILKDVYIIKKVSRGLIIKQFTEGDEVDKFKFINLDSIKEITYKRIKTLLAPL